MTGFCRYIPDEYPFTGKEEVKEEKKNKLKVQSFHVRLSLQSLTLMENHASNYFDKSTLPLWNYNHYLIITGKKFHFHAYKGKQW